MSEPKTYTGIITLASVEDGSSGAPAPYITLTGPTNIIIYDPNTSTYTPNNNFTITGTATNTTIVTWSYSINGGTYNTSPVPSGVARSGDTITITPNLFTNKTVAIKASNDTAGVSDVYTITRLEEGMNGGSGTSALEVILSNETHTIPAASDGSVDSAALVDAYTDVYVYEGTTDKSDEYVITTDNSAGITSSITDITTTTPHHKRITITSVATGTLVGAVTINISKNNSIIATKQFTIAVAKSGADGASGDLYIIETNYDFIYRDQTQKDGQDVTINKLFGPDTLKFKVFRSGAVVIPGEGTSSTYQDSNNYIFLGDEGSDTLVTPDTSYWYDFYYLGPDIDAGGHNPTLPYKLTKTNGQSFGEIDSDEVTVLFHMSELRTRSTNTSPSVTDTIVYQDIYQNCLSGQGCFAFMIYAEQARLHLLKTYVFYIQNLLSESFASFEVTALAIQATVDDKSLAFDSNGLSIYNGDFSIYNVEQKDATLDNRVLYFETGDKIGGYYVISGDKITQDAFGDGTGYLELIDGEYIQTSDTQPNIEKTYYIAYNEAVLRIKGSGEFTGTISASAGKIGGINISENGIYSNNNSFVLNNNGESIIGGFSFDENRLKSIHTFEKDGETYSSIILNGQDGSIYANTITLGVGATIENYIQLGNSYPAFLYNPDYAYQTYGTPYFFTVNERQVYLTANGILQLNKITLDGINSSIFGNADSNSLWPSFSITPTLATFPNIDVGSGKITAAVFEVNHTQAVGGSMLFKPSFQVDSYNIDNHTVTIAGDISSYFTFTNGFSDQYVLVIYNTQIQERIRITNQQVLNNNTILTLEGGNITWSNLTNYPVSIIIIGVDGDVIIGINSSNGTQSFLRPRGLTISEFHPGNNLSNLDTLTEPNVYLGDLSKSGIKIGNLNNELLGYGLFANNVILYGSLTTKMNSTTVYVKVYGSEIINTGFILGVTYYELINGEYTETQDNTPDSTKEYYIQHDTYAGVNTLGATEAQKFGVDDHSQIVFWAGSLSPEAGDIQLAPFQVTELGSLYAARGRFEDSVISKSIIQGVDIYGARIHGIGKNSTALGGPILDYGLSFYNTAQGIVFKSGGDSDDYEPILGSEIQNNQFDSSYDYYEKSGNNYILTSDSSPNSEKTYYIHATPVFSINKFSFHNEIANKDFISIDRSTGLIAILSDNIQATNIIATDLIQSQKRIQINNILIQDETINVGDDEDTTNDIVINRMSYSGSDFNNYIDFNYTSNLVLGKTDNDHPLAPPQLEIQTEMMVCNVNELQTSKNFQLGQQGGGSLHYKQVTNGYDLYIE